MMLKITDKMEEELNAMMDGATFTKDEFLVFGSYKDLVEYLYKDDFSRFLIDVESVGVYDKERDLLENFFYEHPNVIEEGSYGWIYLIK